MKTYLFGKSRKMQLANVVNLACVLYAQDKWPEGQPPLLYVDCTDVNEPIPANDYMTEVTALLTEHGKHDLKKTIEIDDKIRFTLGQVLDRISAIVGPDEVIPQGRLVAGDHRHAAALILEALGLSPRYKIPYHKSKDGSITELSTNVAHSLNAKLHDEDLVPMVNRLVAEGKLDKAGDLKAFGFKHGKSLYVWAKAELVRVYGMTVEDAVRCPDKVAVSCRKEKDPVAIVKKEIAGLNNPAPRALGNAKLDELIKLADQKRNESAKTILEHIRNGRYVPVQDWIVGTAPAGE